MKIKLILKIVVGIAVILSTENLGMSQIPLLRGTRGAQMLACMTAVNPNSNLGLTPFELRITDLRRSTFPLIPSLTESNNVTGHLITVDGRIWYAPFPVTANAHQDIFQRLQIPGRSANLYFSYISRNGSTGSITSLVNDVNLIRARFHRANRPSLESFVPTPVTIPSEQQVFTIFQRFARYSIPNALALSVANLVAAPPSLISSTDPADSAAQQSLSNVCSNVQPYIALVRTNCGGAALGLTSALDAAQAVNARVATRCRSLARRTPSRPAPTLQGTHRKGDAAAPETHPPENANPAE